MNTHFDFPSQIVLIGKELFSRDRSLPSACGGRGERSGCAGVRTNLQANKKTRQSGGLNNPPTAIKTAVGVISLSAVLGGLHPQDFNLAQFLFEARSASKRFTRI
jgi:hypothetical protein